MFIFREYAERYYSKGIHVIPVKGVPCVKWASYIKNPPTLDEYKRFESQFPDASIGAICGEVSGITGLDIDTDDEEILEWCPLSPLVKRGSKGETRFFKYNGEDRRHFLNVKIDLLGNNGYTIMPPSIHPKTKSHYVFTQKILWFDDKDDLPTLSRDFLAELEQRNQAIKFGSEINSVTPGDGSRCAHGSHLKINEIINAGLHNGQDFLGIVKSIIDFDQKINGKVSYFQCPSRKEFKTKDVYINAVCCVAKAAEDLKRKNEIPSITIDRATEIKIVEVPKEEDTSQDYKRFKLPAFEGIGQQIFKDIYASSPKPRTRLAVASSLSLLSLAAGNNFHFDGVFGNLYSMILCPSGGGKDAPLTYPFEALKKADRLDFIGESAPSSDSAILMNLIDGRNVRLDIIDEASKLFAGMNDFKNQFAANMANVYQELFTATGRRYMGKGAITYKKDHGAKNGRIGEVDNPYVVLFCGMTISDFENNFNSNLMEKGLGGRFLYFPDDELKVSSLGFTGERVISSDTVEFLQRFLKTKSLKSGLTFSKKPLRVGVSSGDVITKELHEIEKACLYKAEECKSIAPLLLRHHVMIKKLTLLRAVELQWQKDPADIVIDPVHFDWARVWGEQYLQCIESFLGDRLGVTKQEKVEDEMLRLIKMKTEQGQVASKQYIGQSRSLKRLGVDYKKRREILAELQEQGLVEEVILGETRGFIVK